MSVGQVFVALLLVAATATAVGHVHSKHSSRTSFTVLLALQKHRDALLVESRQLQLERSAWTGHDRILSMATDQLHMSSPQSKVLVNR